VRRWRDANPRGRRSAVEAAYRRSDALTKRRELMAAWADHVTCKTSDNAVPIKVHAPLMRTEA
jgi:hypothetical protein